MKVSDIVASAIYAPGLQWVVSFWWILCWQSRRPGRRQNGVACLRNKPFYQYGWWFSVTFQYSEVFVNRQHLSQTCRQKSSVFTLSQVNDTTTGNDSLLVQEAVAWVHVLCWIPWEHHFTRIHCATQHPNSRGFNTYLWGAAFLIAAHFVIFLEFLSLFKVFRVLQCQHWQEIWYQLIVLESSVWKLRQTKAFCVDNSLVHWYLLPLDPIGQGKANDYLLVPSQPTPKNSMQP